MMRDDRGVANVVGAVLLLAIAVVGMVMVQTTFVPVWGAEEEDNHFSTVLNQFAEMKSSTDVTQSNATGQSISHLITGATDGGRSFLTPQALPGEVQFEPGASSTNLISPAVNVLIKNGESSAVFSEQWVTSNSTTSITEIDELEHLRIRFSPGPNATKLKIEKDNFVQLEVSDKNGAFAGSMMVYVPEKLQDDLYVRVRDATGYTLIDQEFASKLKFYDYSQYWVDALNPTWPFKDVLRVAEGPYSIHMTYDFPGLNENEVPTVDYTVSYRQVGTTGESILQGSSLAGKTLFNYNQSAGGGRILYEPNYQHASRQVVVLENGAVIVGQGDGAAIVIAPDFTVDKIGDVILLSTTIPRLEGSPDSASQSGAMTLTTRALRSETLTGSTTEWTINMQTEYPDAWSTFYTRHMDAAGLIAGTEYTVTTTEDSVVLHVTGAPSNDGAHDIQVKANFPVYKVQVVV